jgi:hypothetical protein
MAGMDNGMHSFEEAMFSANALLDDIERQVRDHDQGSALVEASCEQQFRQVADLIARHAACPLSTPETERLAKLKSRDEDVQALYSNRDKVEDRFDQLADDEEN